MPPLLQTPDLIAGDLIQRCRTAGIYLATVESLTGGMLAGAITSVRGSSEVFLCGWVVYSNDSKRALGVTSAILKNHGSVSEKTTEALLENGLNQARQITDQRTMILCTTGYAEHEDRTLHGLVFTGMRLGEKNIVDRQQFAGTRYNVRRATVQYVLERAVAHVSSKKT